MYVYYNVLGSPISLWINRRDKILHIACLKTNYSRIRINWNYLFDEGKEAEQDKETESLSDEEFKKKMDEEMAKKVNERVEALQRKGVEKAV